MARKVATWRVKEIGVNTKKLIDSDLDRDYWRALVNGALNLQVPEAMLGEVTVTLWWTLSYITSQCECMEPSWRQSSDLSWIPRQGIPDSSRSAPTALQNDLARQPVSRCDIPQGGCGFPVRGPEFSTRILHILYLQQIPCFIKPKGSITQSQGLSNNPYPEPNQPNSS